jgi:NAD+ kinase
MRLRPRIKTIFILTKIFDLQLILMTRDLSRWLLSRERDQEYIIYVEDKLRKHRLFDVEGLVAELCTEYAETERVEAEAAAPPSRQGILAITTAATAAARRKDSLASRLGAWNAEACRGSTSSGVNSDGGAANVDFIITLGGDGTVLYASWLFQQEVPPVVSFALGSLGFLTKFDFGDFQNVLTTAFDAGVTVSRRRRFQGIIMRSEKKRRLPGVTEEEAAEAEEACRDLVEELIGEARETEITHCEERRYEILNEIVVDRGPNPSKCSRNLHPWLHCFSPFR